MTTARRHALFLLAAALIPSAPSFGAADPLTRRLEVDFGRDVPSRNLKGLATRSDGRIVPGPVLTELSGPAIGELLWAIEPAGGKWLAGTGPDGRIVEITLADKSYTVREVVRFKEPQVFALKALADGSIIAGTAPKGALYLVRDGKTVARIMLPAESIFDIAVEPPAARPASGAAPAASVLVATGDPGSLYRVDVAKFAAAGLGSGRPTDAKTLGAAGITLIGSIRDRNLRRVAVLADGRIAAGSAPKGNVYLFPSEGGAPVVLQENRDGEVTDILPEPNGDFYASIVFSPTPGENRINRPGGTARTPAAIAAQSASPIEAAPPSDSQPQPAAPPAQLEPQRTERFNGRSTAMFFPAKGYPETLFTRSGLAFYHLARQGGLLLVAAGEQGEIIGWDLSDRIALTFPGSIGSQLNGIAPAPAAPGRFLLLRNNAPGLASLDFNASAGVRELETGRLDLGVPGEAGSLRFARLRDISVDQIRVELRAGFGSDEAEGWLPWTPLAVRDGAHFAAGIRGRYFKLKISVPAGAAPFEIDTATLYSLPQNRRPVLADFHILPPNLAINPSPEPAAPSSVTLGQVLNPPPAQADSAESRRKSSLLASQLVPSPGRQGICWTVSDADGDTLAYTFSIRRNDASAWTDIAVATRENYAEFDTSALPEGLYLTQLVATEQAPRPESQRLQVSFATDQLLVEHTPPEILEARVRCEAGAVVVFVHGRNALSLLAGAEFVFNNGARETVAHPVDGIADGREESYELRLPSSRAFGATAVEIHLRGQAGNEAQRRLELPAEK